LFSYYFKLAILRHIAPLFVFALTIAILMTVFMKSRVKNCLKGLQETVSDWDIDDYTWDADWDAYSFANSYQDIDCK
jgi:hypothetical protein